MWTKDIWTCDEDSYYGLPYVTDAEPPIPFDGSSIQTPWVFNPSLYYNGLPYIGKAGLASFDESDIKTAWKFDPYFYYGLPYIEDADLPIAIDHSQIRSMWTIMPPFNYDLPFIRLAEDFKYAYGIYVYNTEVETVYTGNHLISHVYTGDTLIKPY